MAEVFRARTMGIGGFEKWVAIKKVLPHLSENNEYMTMLIDEAKISVALNHANIAQVLDLGRINDSYFIAMEYVHGMDLASILKTCAYNNFTIPFEHSIHIAMQVCAGLYHAHAMTDETGTNLGIIHRDVSPHNVLISYDGEVKVIDFGVAKASIKLTHTMSGIIKGKLLYMAPEQAMAKPLDPRADLFAVGLVLYKMATGKLPFEGDNEFQVYNKLVAGKVTAPRKINSAIPEPLERVMVKVLSKKPGGRHADAMALRNDLASVLQVLDPGYTSSRLARFMETYFPPRPISTGETPIVPDPAPPPDGPAIVTQPDTPSPRLTPGAGVAVGGAAQASGAPPPPVGPPASFDNGPPTISNVGEVAADTEDDAHPAPASGPSASIPPPVPASALPGGPGVPPPVPESKLATQRPPIPQVKPADEPTAVVPSFPGLPAAPGGRAPDMNTVAAFIPPMARQGASKLRIALTVLLVLGLVGGIAGGLLYVATEPPAPAIIIEPSPVATAKPVNAEPPVDDKADDGGGEGADSAGAEVQPTEDEIAVVLQSKPTGADVYQGGVLVGTTPTRLILPKKPGAKRRYKIKASGFKTAKKWVHMDKDSTVKVRLKKKKK